MHASLTFVSFVVLLCSSFGQCRHLGQENEISSNDGCEVDNRRYKVGQQLSNLGECMLFTCHEGGAYGAVTCPSVHFREDSGCYETDMNYKKHYPDCCPKIICPKERERVKLT